MDTAPAGQHYDDLETRSPEAREGALLARLPDLVADAMRAAPGWAALPNSVRSRWLERLAAALEARIDDFAHAEARDAGKPFALARDAEIPRAVANLRFFAHAATQFASESHHGEAGLNYTLRTPLGVVAAISSMIWDGWV